MQDRLELVRPALSSAQKVELEDTVKSGGWVTPILHLQCLRLLKPLTFAQVTIYLSLFFVRRFYKVRVAGKDGVPPLQVSVPARCLAAPEKVESFNAAVSHAGELVGLSYDMSKVCARPHPLALLVLEHTQ